MTKWKRVRVLFVCAAIVAPVLVLWFLHELCEAAAAGLDWCAEGRKWSGYLVDRAERFARRNGVRL